MSEIPYLAPITFTAIITMAILLFSAINRKKAYQMLLTPPEDDRWGANVALGLSIVMLLTTIGVLLFEQDVLKTVLYTIPFVIIFTISLFELSGFRTNILLFGTPLRALMGVMLGVIATVSILVLFNVLFKEASLLPVGSITSIEDITNNAPRLFYTVVMAPINEEFFFRAIIFYGALFVLTSFSSTRRLAEMHPGAMFVVLALGVSLIFSLYHIAFATKEPASLALLEFLSFIWILGMQLTGTVAFAIVAHIINNALALEMTIPAIILYILLPIGTLAFIGIAINALLRGKK